MKKLLIAFTIILFMAGCDDLLHPGKRGKILVGGDWVISQDVKLDTLHGKGYLVRTLLWDETGNRGGIVWSEYSYEVTLDKIKEVKEQQAEHAFAARAKMINYVINMEKERKERKEEPLQDVLSQKHGSGSGVTFTYGESATSPYAPSMSAVSEQYQYIITSTGRKAEVTVGNRFFTIDKLGPGESVELECSMEFSKEKAK